MLRTLLQSTGNIPSMARGLMFGLSLYFLPNIVYASSSECTSELLLLVDVMSTQENIVAIFFQIKSALSRTNEDHKTSFSKKLESGANIKANGI